MFFGSHLPPNLTAGSWLTSCDLDHSSFRNLLSINLLLPTPIHSLSTDQMSLINCIPVVMESKVGHRRISWETKLLSTVRGGKPVLR